MIVVVKAGPLTTFQDLGRPGYAHLGVPHSGAADMPALIRANRLVGNADGAVALEMTLLGAQLRFDADALVAFAGAEMPATVDGRSVWLDEAVKISAGQVLRIGAALNGVRGYLAVAGGFDVAPTLGSCATDILSGLGPTPLRDGDVLQIARHAGKARRADPAVRIENEPLLRVLPGPRQDWFVDTALETLCTSAYVVSTDSNRVGVRLDGSPLERIVQHELPSEGLVLGAVQVPANGKPLIFLADHPTTGGYPVIAVVVPEDIPKVAQARPGSRVRFQVG